VLPPPVIVNVRPDWQINEVASGRAALHSHQVGNAAQLARLVHLHTTVVQVKHSLAALESRCAPIVSPTGVLENLALQLIWGVAAVAGGFVTRLQRRLARAIRWAVRPPPGPTSARTATGVRLVPQAVPRRRGLHRFEQPAT